MSIAVIKSRYPALCAVARHSNLDADLKLAMTSVEKDPRGLWEFHDSQRFAANELTFYVCVSTLGGCADCTADDIEADLRKIVSGLSIEMAQSAFGKKLLVNSHHGFQDVRYEIAVAAAALDFFDPGTMSLEARIGDSAKNSDILGKRKRVPYRLEVRVIHNDWPPRLDPKISDQIENVDIPLGYSVSLRCLLDQSSADEVCRIIKAIYKMSLSTKFHYEEPVTILGIEYWFDPQNDELHASDESCPIQSIGLHDDRTIRIVTPPVFIRSMVDRQERDFFANFEGVCVFSGDLADKRTYKDQPLSTKIADAVRGKARQCEEGVCNIVVLGTPSPMVDHDVDDAFTGPLAATFVKSPDGSFSDGSLLRKPSGMFVPAQYSECAENLVDPYRIISAVWHVRLGPSKAQSRVIRNPNAKVPISEEHANALAATRPSS